MILPGYIYSEGFNEEREPKGSDFGFMTDCHNLYKDALKQWQKGIREVKNAFATKDMIAVGRPLGNYERFPPGSPCEYDTNTKMITKLK